MSWQQRTPAGVGPVRTTSEGFTAPIEIPLDEDGYFGRECPSCEGLFKMRKDEYEELPDELELTCPYCGHHDDHSKFMSTAQVRRVNAAAEALAEQFFHAKVEEMLGRAFGGRAGRSGSSISVRYTPGTPPRVRTLPEIAEEQTRRVIACDVCGNHHAVYSATAFCPVCGPRPATQTVLDSIRAANDALAIEDALSPYQVETLRANGVFERIAVDAIKSVVSLFEQFAGALFAQRVADASALTQGCGNVFQRIDDAAALFAQHAALDLPAIAGGGRWRRLRETFAQRHVLVHNGGIVDARFVNQVRGTRLKEGQRLVISRSDAETALADLETIVVAIAEMA